MAAIHAVYLSSEKIQVLSGNPGKHGISLSGAFEIPLPEGAVINGVITDEGPVKDAVSQLRQKGVREVRLVLDSSLILLKKADVPILPPKKLLHVVKQELTAAGDTYEDLIYDYSVVQEKNGQGGGTILCCAMERKFLDGYMELFSEAGIRVAGVDVSLNAVNKLTGMIRELSEKTYILTVLDGNNIACILYENGVYSFSNRSRLFSQRGTDAFAQELTGKISSMIQFSKSQRSPYTISTAYFCGLTQTEQHVCSEISESLGIGAQALPEFGLLKKAIGTQFDCKLADCPYTAGCLIRK